MTKALTGLKAVDSSFLAESTGNPSLARLQEENSSDFIQLKRNHKYFQKKSNFRSDRQKGREVSGDGRREYMEIRWVRGLPSFVPNSTHTDMSSAFSYCFFSSSSCCYCCASSTTLRSLSRITQTRRTALRRIETNNPLAEWLPSTSRRTITEGLSQEAHRRFLAVSSRKIPLPSISHLPISPILPSRDFSAVSINHRRVHLPENLLGMLPLECALILDYYMPFFHGTKMKRKRESAHTHFNCVDTFVETVSRQYLLYSIFSNDFFLLLRKISRAAYPDILLRDLLQLPPDDLFHGMRFPSSSSREELELASSKIVLEFNK
ncbi:hypothetical protein KSP40_PGU001019 [Platanthera guangdongensis]|uniref:Maturase K n=1 Tax=Platanthera guangdongensis TaxID=2320717 RepID=A0ABR2M3E7_9ASPA